MSPSHRPPALILALVVLASACGSDGDPAPAAAPTQVPSTRAEIPAPATSVAAVGDEPVVGPFEVLTEDGLVLEAERFGTGDTFVILAHMRPAEMDSWFSFAGLLAGEGYTAITFNFRGYGNSEGAGFAVDRDVVAVIDAARQLGARRIVLIGASMGGTGSVAAAAQREVDAVVTLSAPATFMTTDAVRTAGDAGVPMLVVAAEDDEPYAGDAFAIAEQLDGRGETLLLEGRAHGTELFFQHSESLTTAILDFISAATAD